MTYSIVAKDPATGAFGVAVASRFFAVGALVPHMAGGVGAIATQAFVNPLYGVEGLEMLRRGAGAAEVVAALTARDEGRASRQLHVVDAAGRVGAFTGAACIDWAGHLSAEHVSVAGNMLAGGDVIAQTLAAYQSAMDLPLAERLMTAMEAGQAAGGDKRGTQSAALKIMRAEAYPWLDIRADDHPDPLAELCRLHAVAQERYMLFAQTMPTAADFSGMRERAEIDAKINATEAERIAAGRPSASFATPLPLA